MYLDSLSDHTCTINKNHQLGKVCLSEIEIQMDEFFNFLINYTKKYNNNSV